MNRAISMVGAALVSLLAGPALAQESEAPEPAVDPAEVERLEAELQALAARLEQESTRAEQQQQELEALREELRAQLAAQRAELARHERALIGDDQAMTVDLEGYYRVRGYSFAKLFDGQEGPANYMEQRLRLRPVLAYKELAKVVFQADALDDAVWGDNASLASTALFAADPSVTDIEGREIPSILINRAWMEVSVPVGVVRAGRMSSHWGMGLLANDGNGFDDTFGENHQGNQFDRVLFATRPLAIGQAIAGKQDSGIPFYAVVAVDRLVEDPLYQYYGYECESGLADSDPDYDPRCDTNGDGLSDLDHSYVDEGREAEDRTARWWADPDDDVIEMVYALFYNGEDVRYLGARGDLFLGGYVINRTQRETDSNVLIADAYVNARWRSLALEFEGLTIQGKSSAIALPGSYDPTGQNADPLAKTTGIWGYVGRLGYVRSSWSAWMEHGYASGDDYTADQSFTGRPLHPDHNVGLLLYEQVIARVTSELWGEDARGLWSGGGVYNSRYIFPNVRIQPLDNWELIGAFLVAWPDRPDGAFIRCAEGDSVDCSQYDATAATLGWEADLALKHRWHEHVLFSLEAGYARATDRLPLEAAGLNPEGSFFTLQSRLAYQF